MEKTTPRLAVLVLLACLVSSAPTAASPIAFTGNVSLVSSPTTFDSSLLTTGIEVFSDHTNDMIPFFSQATAAELASIGWGSLPPGLLPDYLSDVVTTPGTYPPSQLPISENIASGTFVDSYIIYFHPSGDASAAGSITFASDILGFQTAFGNDPAQMLFALHGGYNMPSFYSDPSGFTGAEICDDLPDTCDSVTLSSDRRTLSFSFNATSHDDTLRVFLSPVPEPSSIVLTVSGLAAVIGRRYHSRGRGRVPASNSSTE